MYIIIFLITDILTEIILIHIISVEHDKFSVSKVIYNLTKINYTYRSES